MQHLGFGFVCLFVCVYKDCGFLEFIMIQINVTSFSLQFIYKKKKRKNSFKCLAYEMQEDGTQGCGYFRTWMVLFRVKYLISYKHEVVPV